MLTGDKPQVRVTLERLRSVQRSGATRSLEWRVSALERLRHDVLQRETELTDALRSDLGKVAPESFVTEIGLVVAEIDHVRRNLARWLRPVRIRMPLEQRPGKAYVQREPLGVVLVVAPWNYPAYLTLMPVVAALAAGNCVVAKPSELAPATGEVLSSLLGDGSSSEGTAALCGGAEVVHEALAIGVDHLFFTGSTRVGRLVAEAAGRCLTPVTLELGGKCPAIVDSTADLRTAARRIAWAKFVNAGQTCVAPDYLLVDADVSERLIAELAGALRAMYGPDPSSSEDYARIVDRAHHDRLMRLLTGHGGRVVLGGGHDRDRRYLAPTVVHDPDRTSPLMTEEIFGPVLPVVSVSGSDDALAVVQSHADPLAVYVFSKDGDNIERLRAGTRSGAYCVNVAMSQLGVADLPFAGVGASGSGASHGRWGVESLTQPRSVVTRPSRPDIAVHTPPYSAIKSRIVRRALGVPRATGKGSLGR